MQPRYSQLEIRQQRPTSFPWKRGESSQHKAFIPLAFDSFDARPSIQAASQREDCAGGLAWQHDTSCSRDVKRRPSSEEASIACCRPRAREVPHRSTSSSCSRERRHRLGRSPERTNLLNHSNGANPTPLTKARHNESKTKAHVDIAQLTTATRSPTILMRTPRTCRALLISPDQWLSLVVYSRKRVSDCLSLGRPRYDKPTRAQANEA